MIYGILIRLKAARSHRIPPERVFFIHMVTTKSMDLIRCENRTGEVPVSRVVVSVIDRFSRLRTRGMKDKLEEFLRRDWDNLQVNIFIMSVPKVGILPVTEEAKLCRMVFESWIRMHLGAFTVRPMTSMVMAFHQTLDPEFERLGLNKFDAHKVYLELYPVQLKFHRCNNHVPAQKIAKMFSPADHGVITRASWIILKNLFEDYCSQRLQTPRHLLHLTEVNYGINLSQSWEVR